MNFTYSVPTIPQNLNKQDTIIQIAEALNHLSRITDDIFDRVKNRISSNNSELEKISNRIETVKSKINKLSGARKATQIYSSSKYPAADLNKRYKSIFSDCKPIELVRTKVKLKKEVLSDKVPEKLNIYHVQVKETKKINEFVRGLGDTPVDIECVNDLLLYNSGKNLYKNFVMLDALDGSNQVKEHEVNDNFNIGAAPQSISDRSNQSLSSAQMQSYFYTPTSEEIPVLDVPLDLPDLPNIAGDLRYEYDINVGIGPSATPIPANLPDIPVAISENDGQTASSVDLNRVESSETSEIEVLPPPPPPPPEIVETNSKSNESEKQTVEKIETTSVKHKTEVKDIELPQLDIRASLMDAIRKAGGSKHLKSSDEKPAPQIKNQPTGDLMADLHSKLSMRRKGISGVKKAEFLDAGSALEKISARIPPPVATLENTENSTEDEDWDD